MRNLSSSRKKTLGSVAVVASLALAAPVVATGTAHAATKVNLKGTVSCARFGDDVVPDTITVTPQKGKPGSDDLPGDDPVEEYGLKVTGIPKNGVNATAKIACVDSDDETHTYTKSFKVQKPATGTPQVVNFK
ncbi:hypothetical protein [Streptomyces griseosporeus]|jgi:hypothetical protein|uniref:hypothetical protein n=1 Tax=Streptomyces griseosporeus TaxID=1910 RepID=UPI00369CA74E